MPMTSELLRAPRWDITSTEPLLTREWLVTNGLGGYASGTVAGAVTRRHHGLLVAALPAPLGRTVMLNHLLEEVRLPDGRHVLLGGMDAEQNGRLMARDGNSGATDTSRGAGAAADQFITRRPAASPRRRARTHRRELRTVIAGYHWFTDWGRDTMISLEGLTLAPAGTARRATSCARSRTTCATASSRTCSPTSSTEGLYHTADATLWFFHAADRYLRATATARRSRLLPTFTTSSTTT
jgi:glycogen debranching enzyme